MPKAHTPLNYRSLIIWLCVMMAAWSAPVQANTSAVVLMYHRFGEAKYPTTNTTLAQLDAHIAYLQNNNFNVQPLAVVVAALKARTPLPPKTIAITIDDAYKSVITEAWPRFQRAGFPFTVFVATGAVDDNEPTIMSWEDVRALAKTGVTIGAHSHAHPHAPTLSADTVRQDIATMKMRFEKELGAVPALYAHPYGEAGLEDLRIIQDAGFDAAFGQNSGPVYAEANMFLLPRFAMNETYGAMDRFALVVNTKPLRAVDVRPADPVLRTNPPMLSFRVIDPPGDLSGVSCFGPQGERLAVAATQSNISITPTQKFPTDRARVNCTMKVKNQWYWFGQEFLSGGRTENIAVHPRYRN